MHYAVYITFLCNYVPLDGRMSDSRFLFLRYPVKMQANVPDHILAAERFLAAAAG